MLPELELGPIDDDIKAHFDELRANARNPRYRPQYTLETLVLIQLRRDLLRLGNLIVNNNKE